MGVSRWLASPPAVCCVVMAAITQCYEVVEDVVGWVVVDVMNDQSCV